MLTRKNLKAILRGRNVKVEGIGFLGKVGDIEPPKVEFNMVEDGNMGRKVDTALLKPMECKITIFDANPHLIKVVGKRLKETANFVIQESVATDKGEIKVLFSVTGQVETQESVSKEVAKEYGETLTISVVAYELEVDGKKLYDIDVDAYKCIIDGKDYYEELRANIE